MGDLESRLGQIESAQEHYAQAEQLYRKEKANLGLANTLRSMGYLESRLGQIESAQEHYAQAEQLFRKEKNNLGLANTLLSMGDLERGSENYDSACNFYETAFKLYQDVQEPVGKAYVLAELCRTYPHIREKDFAVSFLLETEAKFDTFPEYTKSYVAKRLIEAMKLLGL
jgi:tetratricopeptide (TPR) repeat protein